jgi:hypothetical protein
LQPAIDAKNPRRDKASGARTLACCVETLLDAFGEPRTGIDTSVDTARTSACAI